MTHPAAKPLAEWIESARVALERVDAEPENADALLAQALRQHGQPAAT